MEGDVRLDTLSRRLYATDASIYEIEPVGVILPRTTADVVHAVRVAGERGLSLLPRGGGTSLAGQAVGESLQVDFSRYMNRILEVDAAGRWARVEPGVVLDEVSYWTGVTDQERRGILQGYRDLEDGKLDTVARQTALNHASEEETSVMMAASPKSRDLGGEVVKWFPARSGEKRAADLYNDSAAFSKLLAVKDAPKDTAAKENALPGISTKVVAPSP